MILKVSYTEHRMNPQIKQAFIGFARGAGFLALIAVLDYAGDVTHLTFLGTYAPFVAVLALAAEHYLSPSGTALFGAVKTA